MKRIFICLLLFNAWLVPAWCATEGLRTQPRMLNSSDGWWLKITDSGADVSRTHDGGQHWQNVSPPEFRGLLGELIAQKADLLFLEAELCPLDAQHAWVSFDYGGSDAKLPPKDDKLQVVYTNDGGQYWQAKPSLPARGGLAGLSFLNDHEGYVLTTSQALGNHHETVWHTTDAAKHWNELNSPPRDGLGYYVTGISFRSPQEGWISASYHGPPDVPLFHTQDGGKSWQLQKFARPDVYREGYVNTYPPVFVGKEKMQGYLPAQIVRNEPKPSSVAWVTYESKDGGATWHVPASGIQYTPRG